MTVRLCVSPNEGYSFDQIESGITLGELLAQVEDAITDYGENTSVVVFDFGNRYGAKYGSLSWEMFEPCNDEDD